MTKLGAGHCDIDYLAGWDGKGTASESACKKVCMEESRCTYASWLKDKTCSRYHGVRCNKVAATDTAASYVTFKKKGGKGLT